MTGSSALPRAVISRSALTAAAAAAVAAGGEIADLRRDAWGHGLLAVARAVVAAGASAVLVDTQDEVDQLAHERILGLRHGEADIDPEVLYGLPDASGELSAMPVLRLAGSVLSTKLLRAGEAVSYGYTYRAPHDTRVALVTGGYAQGIVRGLGNRVRAEVDGRLRPIVGRIAMDVCVIDLEGDDVPLGNEVTFFGGLGPAGSALHAWSAQTGLTARELLCVAALHAAREEEA